MTKRLPQKYGAKIRSVIRLLARLVSQKILTASEADKILANAMVEALKRGAGQKQP